MLTTEEIEILQYLKSFPGSFISAREISRRASGQRRRHHESRWADLYLNQLVEKQLVETDNMGRYRCLASENEKQEEKKERKVKKWMSPQIQRILAQSGKTFEGIEDDGDRR